MGTLKTTLKVESTDLFPTPVSFTVVNNNSVNGSYSGFNNLTVTSLSQILNPVAAGATGAYVYLQSVATNPAGIAIEVKEDNGSELFATLYPGDVAFLPYNSAAGQLTAEVASGTASLNFFVGDRG